MLIDGMLEEYKKNFQDAKGNFLDVCEWKSNETLTPCVRCVEGRVQRVELSNITFAEIQFPFHFIPPLAEQFIVMNCNIHGTLETSDLPNDMLSFHVKYSCLYGSIHWGSFPRKLKFLQIGKNALSGSIILTDLPDALITLAAESNKFGGGIDLNHLPKGMKVLELQGNILSGRIYIEHLPESMEKINLADTVFEGDLWLMSFPPSLKEIKVGGSLSGKAIVSETSSPMHFKLGYPGIKIVADEKGKTHAWEKQIIQRNML